MQKSNKNYTLKNGVKAGITFCVILLIAITFTFLLKSLTSPVISSPLHYFVNIAPVIIFISLLWFVRVKLKIFLPLRGRFTFTELRFALGFLIASVTIFVVVMSLFFKYFQYSI